MNERESEELLKKSERGKLLSLYKKYKYIWGVAYAVGLIVWFVSMEMVSKPSFLEFMFFVIAFGLIGILVYWKIRITYQRERQIITDGKEELYPFN